MTGRLVVVALVVLVLAGCGRQEQPSPVAPVELFPKLDALQSNRLEQAASLLRGSSTNLDLSWVGELGAAAVPSIVQWSVDTNLTAEARDGVLVLLGSSLKSMEVREHPDARNDVIVPALIQSLGDRDARVRRSAAYAARFVSDARLVVPLRTLFDDKDIVQEQAVLAMGSSGDQMDVLPILKLFFGTTDGKFRYSCLYALSTMCLLHDVDMAPIIRQNIDSFGEKQRENAESVAGRFVEFRVLRGLVKQFEAGKLEERVKAGEKLRERAGKDLTAEAWKAHLLRDFWMQAPPRP